MPEYLEFFSESEIKSLLQRLEDDTLAKGADVFIDNSSFAWPLNHLETANSIKRIDYSYLRKTNQFYQGLNDLIVKYGRESQIGGKEGKLHIIKVIGEELKKGAGACMGVAGRYLNAYQNLTSDAKNSLVDDAETVLQELQDVMKSFYQYAGRITRQDNSSPITEKLEELLFEARKHFNWRGEVGNNDLFFVAAAFEKAILSEGEIYIVTEDQPMTAAVESLHNLLVCKQTGVSRNVLERILPLNIFVWRTDKDKEFYTKFNCHEFPPGNQYNMRTNFRDHFSRGTVLGTTAIRDAEKKLPEKANKTLHSLLRYLPKKVEPKKPLEEQEEPIPCEPDESEPILGEFEEQISRKPAVEKFPEPEKISSTAAHPITKPAAKKNLQDIFEIVSEYARAAYENHGQTPEKEKAMSAFEELTGFADENLKNTIDAEINYLINLDLTYHLEEVNIDITDLAGQIKSLTSTEDWYSKPENIAKLNELNTGLQKKQDKKKRIEEEIQTNL